MFKIHLFFFVVQFDAHIVSISRKYIKQYYVCERFHEKINKFTYQTHNILGGSNGRGAILDVTRGHFEDGFTGCLRNIVIQNIQVFTAQMEEISGKNIRTCSS